jgi:hypothetical protein
MKIVCTAVARTRKEETEKKQNGSTQNKETLIRSLSVVLNVAPKKKKKSTQEERKSISVFFNFFSNFN